MREGWMNLIVFLVVAIVLVALVGGACAGIPAWRVYDQTQTGKARLAEAESSRQIAVEEAEAQRDAAEYLKEARIIEAEGEAEANRIIGDSLKEPLPPALPLDSGTAQREQPGHLRGDRGGSPRA